jgi:CXXX repeat peptide maturase
VIRSNKADFVANSEAIIPFLGKAKRINIVLSDITAFTDADFSLYASQLDKWRDAVKSLCLQGIYPQLNFLTDRILLDRMNNCNAGIENITLAPNGKFYVCPAFYLENENDCVGDLLTGLDIKNQALYKLQNAPLCRNCDAYQCKRCVWLNRNTTSEINTPSHEQCVVAYLE